MRGISAAAAAIDVLDRENVRCVFGVPGGPVLGLCDEIERHPNVSFVLTKHEQGAAYAAFAYARVTGGLGVCLGTLGPGATNLLAGLPVAAIESVPVLAITGQVQTTAFGRGAHQEHRLVRHTGSTGDVCAACKHSCMCTDPQRRRTCVTASDRVVGRPGRSTSSSRRPAAQQHQLRAGRRRSTGWWGKRRSTTPPLSASPHASRVPRVRRCSWAAVRSGPTAALWRTSCRRPPRFRSRPTCRASRSSTSESTAISGVSACSDTRPPRST